MRYPRGPGQHARQVKQIATHRGLDFCWSEICHHSLALTPNVQTHLETLIGCSCDHESVVRGSILAFVAYLEKPNLSATLPRFVGLDYSRNAVPAWVRDTRGKALGNHICPESAWFIDEAVRRFGSVRGAALEACAGAVSANKGNSDPRAMREEEDGRLRSRGGGTEEDGGVRLIGSMSRMNSLVGTSASTSRPHLDT